MTASTGIPATMSRPDRNLLSSVRSFAPIVVTLALLSLVPLRYGDSRLMMGLAVDGLAFASYAIAFNVIFGSTRQLFLCVGALAGIGGYGAAIFGDVVGLPIPVGIALAAAISAVVGGLLSWVAVSRSLDVIFTGIVTLAFSLSFANLLLGRRELTGGEAGLVVHTGSGGFLREQVAPYYLFLAVVGIYLVVFRVLQRSHIGWAFRALHDDELAAELTGINVARYRVFAGVIGSLMLGLTGAIFAYSEGFVSPTTFGFGHIDIRVLVMLGFGGIGTLLGPVVGAVTFTILDELMVPFGQLRVVSHGVLIVALFLGFRRGLIPTLQSMFMRRARRKAQAQAGPLSTRDSEN